MPESLSNNDDKLSPKDVVRLMQVLDISIDTVQAADDLDEVHPSPECRARMLGLASRLRSGGSGQARARTIKDREVD